jgi:hypothetical protein
MAYTATMDTPLNFEARKSSGMHIGKEVSDERRKRGRERREEKERR